MRDIMVDLETLGQRPGCAILSIGARAFDPATGELGQAFHAVVSTASCLDLGLVEDPETIDWWGRQSDEARTLLARAADSETDLVTALEAFAAWVRDLCAVGQVRVWGNGADFDNAILAHLYVRVGQGLPWQFWNNRCYRTLKNLIRLPEAAREGVYHDALDDATHQARHALKLLAALEART